MTRVSIYRTITSKLTLNTKYTLHAKPILSDPDVLFILQFNSESINVESSGEIGEWKNEQKTIVIENRFGQLMHVKCMQNKQTNN